MFVMVSASGLMATAQIAPIAKDFKSEARSCSLVASHADRRADCRQSSCNGGARPLFGWVSDISAARTRWPSCSDWAQSPTGLLGTLGNHALLFVLFVALVFFTWGEIFSLFPSTCTDTYGAKYATTNYGLLYTAKGTSAVVVPLANVLKTHR